MSSILKRFIKRNYSLSKYLGITILAFLFIQNAHAQYVQGVRALIGTSSGIYKGVDKEQNGFLIPTFGAAYSYQLDLGKQFFFRPSLGYLNRGTKYIVDATVNEDLTLGTFKASSRDHFISNDLILHFQPTRKKVNDLVPYIDFGVRNDFYGFTTFKQKSSDPYFSSNGNKLELFRSKNLRPYAVGFLANVGVVRNDWEFGLEYYHQVSDSFDVPTESKSQYTRLRTHSLQFSVSFRY